MRIALISALKQTGQGVLRAEEPIAGRALLEWQVDLALELGCERVLCLCEASSSVVLTQQQRVEGAGLSFHTIRGPLQISGLVRDEDDLVLQLDGLLVSAAGACDLFLVGGELDHTIWTISEGHALSNAYPADFERIDRERNWAGLAVIPGECARKLSELPGDGDAVSLLLRLALQSRTQCKPLPAEQLEGDNWLLVSDHAALERRGVAMVEASLPAAHWAGPAHATANAIVRRSGPFWLQSAPEISGLGAIALGVIGAGAASFGIAIGGIVLAGLGGFLVALSANAGEMRSRLGGALGGAAYGRMWRTGLPLAVGILAILTLILANSQSADWPVRISLPIFAIGLAMIAGYDRVGRISAFWRDLPVHMAFFALVAGLGYLQEGLIVFALSALLQLALRTKKQ